ncbi:hypothetical protein I312_101973 [Cryptococcus bacillisporus CA1280]|uniref:Uncharacterized protein n=1 Tax=Cryptococcus bacillisporus CA1280 TaxID=1296109 RepID=A0A0D0VRF4_CRYGA|nr:hypothetical protein I312_02074 [Cryptococcus bacillisporus CA1280]
MPVLSSLFRLAPDPLPAHPRSTSTRHFGSGPSGIGHIPAQSIRSMATPPTWIKRPMDYLKSLFYNQALAAKGIALSPHQEKTEPDPEILFMREVCRKERLELLGRHKDYAEFDLGLCMDMFSRDTSQQRIIQKEMESRTKRVRSGAEYPQLETIKQKQGGCENGKLGARLSIRNEAIDFSRTTEAENKQFIKDNGTHIVGLTRHFQATRAPPVDPGGTDGPKLDYPTTTTTTHSCLSSKVTHVISEDIDFRPKKKLRRRYAPSTLSSQERLHDLLADAQNDLKRHEEERRQWTKGGRDSSFRRPR